MPLMRCESRGTLDLITEFTTLATFSFTCVALALSLWHERLRHPGVSILHSLRKNKFIECNQIRDSRICHSCSLGKHIKLPFVLSHSHTLMPFDIVHTNLWTSPILSSSGHQYYILLLDDYSKFLWTFPFLTN